MFDEKDHPRDSGGKFTEKSASELKYELMQELPSQTAISEKKIDVDKNVVEVDLNSEVQKQFDSATPKERSKIAKERYGAVLNIGIRNNGDSTLYDINQFKKE